MKKNYFLAGALFIGMFYADESKEHFLQAKECVKNVNYAQAIEHLKAIENPGIATWYALGMCYTETHDNVHALIAYKSALHHAPITLVPQIYERVVASEVALGVAPKASWFLYVRMAAALIPLKIFQWIVMLLWILTIIYICMKKKQSKIELAALSFGWIILFCGLFITWYYNLSQELIVIQNTFARSGPDEEYQSLRSLSVGTSLRIKKQQGSWYKCSDFEGIGWIQNEHVEQVR